MDGGACSPARCRASNFQFEPRQFCPQGKTAESCGFCASYHPLHNLLEFSAKTLAANCARKRFLLWEMGFPDAKISTRLRRTGRRRRFYCERASALSHSPRVGGQCRLSLGNGFLGRFDGLMSGGSDSGGCQKPAAQPRAISACACSSDGIPSCAP